MKDHVKILIVGDEGVGKSSLISSYISRYFSPDVPPVVTDSYLGSDTTASGVSVTIMDSSSRSGDHDILIHKIRCSDVIIACYDRTRLETHDSLASKWLPLIQKEHSKEAKVIITGTKTDLLNEQDREGNSEEDNLSKELFQKFPNEILLAFYSSSKSLYVDHVFYNAEQVVTYPLSPIYDLNYSQFTPACLRAFLHIFRIYDTDGDGLLSDIELNRLHSDCFNSSFNREELVEFKKQIAKYTASGIKQNKVTFEGLISMIKRLIECSQFVTPWAILRRYDYDDDLNLEIPKDLEWIADDSDNFDYVTQLSHDATEFLERLYISSLEQIKSSDVIGDYPKFRIEDYLGNLISLDHLPEAEIMFYKTISSILSVITPDIATPWKSYPIYEDDKGSLLYAINRKRHKYLLSSPPVRASSAQFVDHWLLHWHMLALYNPTITQIMLYRLGYVDRPLDKGIVFGPVRPYLKSKSYNKQSNIIRPTLRISIFGGNGVGKRSFVWTIARLPNIHRDVVNLEIPSIVDSQLDDFSVAGKDTILSISINSKASGGENEMESSIQYTDDHEILTGGCLSTPPTMVMSMDFTKNKLIDFRRSSSNQISIIITAVPFESTETYLKRHGKSCDLAVLLFERDNLVSLDQAMHLESLLPVDMPRMFVANKFDLPSVVPSITGDSQSSSITTGTSDNSLEMSTSVNKAMKYIKEQDLLELKYVTMTNKKSIDDCLTTMIQIAYNPIKGIPMHLRKSNKALSWFTWPWLAVSACGVGMVAGVIIIVRRNPNAGENGVSSLSWSWTGKLYEFITSWTKNLLRLR